ncbi:4-hydroxyacetophenone monooxygenase [Mycobacterium paraintracellulare]|uniref:flavin-containing monooxygenase n=1 Tax=Mycobacterium paraintracellulare TaxID=1138383 RepID=UPI001925C22E|nr:NAD(P)/FAD-dependent oxidoreductase [Mycobacterium paraintracellulare]BCP07995.1 4-hydroxyacetophenone monooxygenase [Mycobacterium paraintracellulare]
MTGADEGGRRFATIIGAGPGGIATAIALKDAGIEDFVILEQNATAGGTWTNNRYPGLCCDVPSTLYEFSFERKPDWSKPYGRQTELRRYIRDVADKYGVTPHIRYQTPVVGAQWDHIEGAWTITADDGWTTSSTVLIGAVGMFNRLRWPDIPGLQDFAGTTVHSGNWPTTGVDITDKTVAVVGTAASAVQMIPELAKEVDRLYVFQRSPNWIFPKDDPDYSYQQLEEFRADPSLHEGPRADFTDFIERFATMDQPDLLAEMQADGMKNLAAVKDPELREKMRPTLPVGAQRPLFSNSYYPTFNEKHVELVTDPISHVTPRGVATSDGRERPVDVLVLATGYDTTKFLSVLDITGRDGRSLAEEWAQAAYAYKGITVPGFPNLFMLYGPNTNNGIIIRMLEAQADYIADKVRLIRDRKLHAIEVRSEETERYNQKLQRDINAIDVWRTVGSRYYRAASGQIVTQWPGTMAAFERLLAEPDDNAFVMTEADSVEQSRVDA